MSARRTAESIFTAYFLPLYPDRDLAHTRTTDANPAGNPSIVAEIDDAARVFAGMAHGIFGQELDFDRSDASVHRISRAITRARRDHWLANGTVGTSANELFNIVVHGALYVGACVVQSHGGTWLVRRPLWESLVRLESRAGIAELAVFQWWLKSIADDAFEPSAITLADRYRTHVEVPTMRFDALTPITPDARRLPRITKVRYDVLYKHLKAHLPELRDLGTDFPSPERFDEMGFGWLDFLLVGDGRMLLVYGAGKKGLHLFWISTRGFEKSAFYPADASREPSITARGEMLEVALAIDGRNTTHEMLWWGP